MRPKQYVELRQGQSMIMAPQVLQSIKLLQLSHVELISHLEAEIERNPFLQEVENSAPALSYGGSISPSSSRRVGSSKTGEVMPDLEITLADTASLTDHLEAQLVLATSDARTRATGLHLIHSLNEAGYLTDRIDDIAERLGETEDHVAEALHLIQNFDPPGIGARNLAECLSLQLREQKRLDPAMAAMLARLDLVAKQDFAALRSLCGVGDDDLMDMFAEIRRLDPKPGLSFGSPRTDVLVPDVLVRHAPDGSLVVELNPDTLPKVLLDQSYYARVVQSTSCEKDKIFIAERLQSAQWLVRSLDQRANTILKVATEIVRQQQGFFHKGTAFLRPLILKNVAEAIGMHESTVSRVVSNKAIGTLRGTFLMKYFFNAATGESGHSSEAVRHRIKQFIEAEDPRNVLSDDAIMRKLQSEGIDIARRTVAKYRQTLRISSSADRRRKGAARQPSRSPAVGMGAGA